MDGKPHLGTDKLVLILKQLRAYLESLGAKFLFGECVTSLLTTPGTSTTRSAIRGIRLRSGG